MSVRMYECVCVCVYVCVCVCVHVCDLQLGLCFRVDMR